MKPLFPLCRCTCKFSRFALEASVVHQLLNVKFLSNLFRAYMYSHINVAGIVNSIQYPCKHFV